MKAVDAQLTLFGGPPRPAPTPAAPAHPSNRSDTSRAAAAAAAPRSPSARELLLSIVAAAGEHGATYDELETASGLPRSSISARLNELVKAARIADSGRRRRTRYGCHARVYVLVSPCGCFG